MTRRVEGTAPSIDRGPDRESSRPHRTGTLVAPRFGSVLGLCRRVRRSVLRVLGVASREDLSEVQVAQARLTKMDRRAARAATRLDHRLGDLLREQHSMRDRLGGPTRGIEGVLRRVERNVHAVIRDRYLDHDSLPFPHNILSQRFHLWSQNEEDGITLALFKKVGAPHRSFVDIGAGVNGGNSGLLADVCGWTGVMVEASAERVSRLAVRFGRFGVKTVCEWVTRENVNGLLDRQGVTGDVDLLSIDIDGNDYWVWQAITVCAPRVVIVEFNPFFGRTRSVVVRYDPRFDRAHYRTVCRTFFGASLGALARLAATLGYRLILAEPRGGNAYFLRNDVDPSIPGAPPEAVHPKSVSGVDALFELIERKRLPLIDLDRDPEDGG